MARTINGNLGAFLDTIAASEGTYGLGDDGYNVLVGSTPAHPLLFPSYADHPRILNRTCDSTAAGRYQLLERYYDDYADLLGLDDFSPASQDAIAVQQIKECLALDDATAGRFAQAVQKCAHIWASLPNAGYGQHENTLAVLQQKFADFGGALLT